MKKHVRYWVFQCMILCIAGVLVWTMFACRSFQSGGAQSVKPVSDVMADFDPNAVNEPPLAGMNRNGILPGRYLGYVRLKQRQEKVPLTFDLLTEKSQKKSASLQAFVKLSLGGFRSSEYSTTYFSDVQFSQSEQRLSFKNDGKVFGITNTVLKRHNLLVGTVVDKEGVEQGDFIAVYSGKRRSIDAESHVKAIFKSLPTVATISGKYAGTCKEKSSAWEVEAAKWNSSREPSTPILDDYKIVAKSGYVDPFLCGVKDKGCTRATYTNAKYDLFAGTIAFAGQAQPKLCKQTKDGMECDQCQLLKDGKSSDDIEMAFKRLEPVDFFDFTDDAGDKLGADPKSFEGEYYGYLFHEYLGLYQLFRLKVEAKSGEAEVVGVPKVNSVATLFFGDPKNKEFIAHRFEDQPLNINGRGQVFHGAGESVFQISHWDSKTLQGLWYSKVFGRIGSVNLFKGKVPSNLKETQQIRSLSGTYKNDRSKLTLAAAADVSDSERDFFPMSLKGVLQEGEGKNAKRMIEAVSYDFMSGNIALRLDDRRIISGRFEPATRSLQLSWTSPNRFGAVMDDARHEVYEFELSEPGDIAADMETIKAPKSL